MCSLFDPILYYCVIQQLIALIYFLAMTWFCSVTTCSLSTDSACFWPDHLFSLLFSLSHRLLLFSSFSFLFPSHFVFLVSDFLFHFFFSSLRFCESSVSHRPKLNNLFFILLTVTLRVRDLEAYTCFFHLLSLLFTCMFSFRHVIFHC